jgi:hypothetical protein
LGRIPLNISKSLFHSFFCVTCNAFSVFFTSIFSYFYFFLNFCHYVMHLLHDHSCSVILHRLLYRNTPLQLSPLTLSPFWNERLSVYPSYSIPISIVRYLLSTVRGTRHVRSMLCSTDLGPLTIPSLRNKHALMPSSESIGSWTAHHV